MPLSISPSINACCHSQWEQQWVRAFLIRRVSFFLAAVEDNTRSQRQILSRYLADTQLSASAHACVAFVKTTADNSHCYHCSLGSSSIDEPDSGTAVFLFKTCDISLHFWILVTPSPMNQSPVLFVISIITHIHCNLFVFMYCDACCSFVIIKLYGNFRAYNKKNYHEYRNQKCIFVTCFAFLLHSFVWA
jgi:hypothetical protein